MSEEAKLRYRDRHTALTKKDLEDFTEIVRARYPDLYIQETRNAPGSLRVLDHFGQVRFLCDVCPSCPDPAPYLSKYLDNGIWKP